MHLFIAGLLVGMGIGIFIGGFMWSMYMVKYFRIIPRKLRRR